MRKKMILFLAIVLALAAECIWLTQRRAAPIDAVSEEIHSVAATVTLTNVRRYERDEGDFVRRDGRICYPDAEQGIDVSEHQGKVDWEKVRESGISFVILRAAYRGYTEGKLKEDATFRENLQGAKNAGLKVGVYVFSQAINTAEAAEEATFAAELLEGTELELPIYFDWESVTGTKRADRLTSREITDNALAFCAAVREAGYRAGVYFNSTVGYWKLNLTELEDCDFWLAQYEEAPEYFYDFQVWQYDPKGNVDGIETVVDLNLRFREPEGNT